MISDSILCTAQQIKSREQQAIQKDGIPSLVLMERAGLALWEHLPEKGSIAIVCGNGNNGADGLCLARLLTEQGRNCTVFVKEEGRRTEEYAHQMERLLLAGFQKEEIRKAESGTIGTLSAYAVIVDALFGVGFNRAPEGLDFSIIQEINRAGENGSYILSVDIPSGVDATTGNVPKAAVHADKTVTFSCKKTGMVFYPGRIFCGEVVVAEIGLPSVRDNGKTQFPWFSYEGKVAEYMPKRIADSHKGNYGTVTVIAGSKNMPGAATLCTKAAYRSGAGIVRLLSEKETVATVRQTVPEVIAVEIDEKKNRLEELLASSNSLVIGPGLGTGADTKRLVDAVIESGKPSVLDADALNCLSKRLDLQTDNPEKRVKLLNEWLNEGIILTPHKKELARLLGMSVGELSSCWYERILSLKEQIRFVLVMKDACTVVVSRGGIYLNQSGNSGMSTGGSGDVLAGITGTFLAVMPPMEAACAAVYLHGFLGDLAAESGSKQSLMASDLIEEMKRITE